MLSLTVQAIQARLVLNPSMLGQQLWHQQIATIKSSAIVIPAITRISTAVTKK